MSDLLGRLVASAWRWLTLFGGVMIFLALSLPVGRATDPAVDDLLSPWLGEIARPSVTTFMLFVTWLGSGWTLAAVVTLGAGVLLWQRKVRHALYLCVTGIGAWLLNAALKVYFVRARPDELMRLAEADGYSFPSGHSMGSAAVYVAIAAIIAYRFPDRRVIAIALSATIVLLVGISRAYLFVHYPSDVLAGWGLGVSWALWLRPSILGRKPERVPAGEIHVR